jgi:hypothetical protein
MPVMAITSMPYSLATIWARWGIRLLAVVEIHPEVGGVGVSANHFHGFGRFNLQNTFQPS